jgi:hypothetical protein
MPGIFSWMFAGGAAGGFREMGKIAEERTADTRRRGFLAEEREHRAGVRAEERGENRALLAEERGYREKAATTAFERQKELGRATEKRAIRGEYRQQLRAKGKEERIEGRELSYFDPETSTPITRSEFDALEPEEKQRYQPVKTLSIKTAQANLKNIEGQAETALEKAKAAKNKALADLFQKRIDLLKASKREVSAGVQKELLALATSMAEADWDKKYGRRGFDKTPVDQDTGEKTKRDIWMGKQTLSRFTELYSGAEGGVSAPAQKGAGRSDAILQSIISKREEPRSPLMDTVPSHQPVDMSRKTINPQTGKEVNILPPDAPFIDRLLSAMGQIGEKSIYGEEAPKRKGFPTFRRPGEEPRFGRPGPR